MAVTKKVDLLQDKNVMEEISRHRWLESEKTGSDIGFDKASADWIARYSEAWILRAGAKGKKASKGNVNNA